MVHSKSMFTLSSRISGSRTGKMILCALLIIFTILFFRLNRNLPSEDSALKGMISVMRIQVCIMRNRQDPDPLGGGGKICCKPGTIKFKKCYLRFYFKKLIVWKSLKTIKNKNNNTYRYRTVRSVHYIYSMLNVFYIFFHFRLLFLPDPRGGWCRSRIRIRKKADVDPVSGSAL